MSLSRLDKIISDAGICSRREVKRLVRQGRVTVNGLAARSVEEKCDAGSLEIRVDGERIDCAGFYYYMLNKPTGALTATVDKSRQTVLDLLPERLRKQGLFPVGRLDKDTTGLLLLTNDGDFAHRVTSPRSRVPKLYAAVISAEAQEADVTALGEGLVLADGTKCLPARLEIMSAKNEVNVTVCEGKYHQVRRMLAARGKPVLSLKRIAIGGLTLDPALGPGEFRPLTEIERESVFGRE